MHMPATQHRWTAAAVRALPDDGKRYELIDGELLVTPAPGGPHQEIVGELYFRLRQYLDRDRVAHVMMSPADIELEPGTIVQPDVFVLPGARRARAWTEVKELLLACEVLSPSTARYDRVTKRRFFARASVGEYWVLDPEAEVIERSVRGEPRIEVVVDQLAWTPVGSSSAFTLDVAEFFRATRAD
jgi:Uma2 family endonuclease